MKAPKKTRGAVVKDVPKKVYNTAPVIVKCTGDGCAKREACVRFTSTPAETNQPWFTESVSIPDKNKCSFFMENDSD